MLVAHSLARMRNNLICSCGLQNATKLTQLIFLTVDATYLNLIPTGTDDWEFKFEPSQMKNGGLPPREPNNIAVEFDSDSSDDMKKKAVTFAAAKVNDRERRSKKSKMSQENMSRASSCECT